MRSSQVLVVVHGLLVATTACGAGGSPPSEAADGDAHAADAVDAVGPGPGCSAQDRATQPAHPTGAYTLTPGEAYVVYSELRQTDSPFVETSNMFVLRGEADPAGVDVWIYGTGYGDSAGIVYFPYPRTVQYPSRGAAADVADLDHTIASCLGVAPGRARLRVVAPHYHFDHLNAEVVEGLLDRGYPIDQLAIYVHDLDFDAAFCGQPCAGTATGGGALPAFSSAAQRQAVRLGSPTDACGATVLTFTTPALGTWEARLDPGHTAGTLSLDNRTLGVRLKGAAQGCVAAEGLRPVAQHGIGWTWPE